MTGQGKLILLRHGQSTLNAQGRFTGLLDPPLTPQGRAEAVHAADILVSAAFAPDTIFSSTMVRAVETGLLVSERLTGGTVPVRTAWELNERSYGSLTGRLKKELLAEFGPQVLHYWRRSLYAAPPPMTPRQLTAIRSSNAAADMPPGTARATESLNAVATRVNGFWYKTLRPLLRDGKNVLAVAHGNSLRALCLILDSLTEEEVEGLNLPTGHPLEYSFHSGFIPYRRGGTYLDPDAAALAVSLVAADGGT
ncbi:2,3-bisphosphoglycerate-dependent phosphoglycerate mutase [Arthrobacter cryoconiti]|uniref:2,3-bisphosphoglycerate-dependent phosphoglycerate mutase n=1 Tax=Arthrobacter cryoconiti TaxID=748907 RepID=A0ABV8R074_9MICC|nr:2,3-diphosphoglycerate-dependent phosphoglycerate mutase [Arthrobacter cryoconiti]MCC9069945.1 2,3-diphosphoglycerate-dependent phosphoglycerate mutase [Arthrobacter cryoconiti]